MKPFEQEQLQELLTYYKSIRETGGQELLIALLREIQSLCGCVPPAAQAAAAAAMKTAPAAVAALVKRLPGLNAAPYAHRIVVCTGPRCAAKGGAAVLKVFETALGIKAGQVTDDGRFLLDTQNCLKQCGSAPNTRIDNDLFKQVAPDLVPEILAQYP